MALRPPPEDAPLTEQSRFASLTWKRWFRELWNLISTYFDPQNPVTFETEMTRDTDLRDRVNALEAQVMMQSTSVPQIFLILDTAAHQANYPAASFAGVFYIATDTNTLYAAYNGAWHAV